MTAITILIAEDEAPQRRALREALAAQWPEVAVVIECANGTEALQALNEHQPQVAFLDIRMPGHSGLDVAKAASGRTHVVFVTAYDEYAVKAFESEAVDYLLKPVNWVRLASTITRLKTRLNTNVSQVQPADLSALLKTLKHLEQQQTAQPIRWITASVGEVVKVLSIDDVLCFQSDNKYTRVLTRTGEAVIRTPIKELLPSLDANAFWQIHRGSVVRVSAIQKVKRNELGRLQLQLTGCAEHFNVSETYQHRFKSM